MQLASIRLITADVDRLVSFYETVTRTTADRPAPVFAEIVTSGGVLAIGDVATVPLFGAGSARPADNHSAIVEFRVDDVDAEWERLSPVVDDVVQTPTTMPWGNRSLLIRDPDGTLVNLFTPVAPDAIARQDR
ncbi:VOC family protein [Williamsia deligens]|uniref:VOC family protein n=1 Tax=Williamsia deligens TaxID=321325 RepID=A0ABW3GC28_9NOCA|nr:VOC family protein [Williamsia deligens]MCP2192885.1 Glyoxalase-like domain-containing protein [Williamsia deligens]